MPPRTDARPAWDWQDAAIHHFLIVRRKIVAFTSALLLGGCTAFGIRSGTPQPEYSVTGRIGPVQLRDYGPRLAAETTVQGDEIDARSAGFRKLAAYIFGANTKPGGGSGKIAMTTPVEQDVVVSLVVV